MAKITYEDKDDAKLYPNIPDKNKINGTDMNEIKKSVNEAYDELDKKVDIVANKGLSTNDYTTSEKTKLAGIATGANNYTLPTASSTVLGGVKIGTNLTIDGNGVLNATGGSGGTSNYPDLTNKPILNTNNTSTQTANATETITGTINLHKIAKTGSYNDILNKPTIPNATTIVDNLTSTSTTSALSANQGKVLKESLDTKLSSVPNATATTVGGLKVRYDSSTQTLYITNDGTNP